MPRRERPPCPVCLGWLQFDPLDKDYACFNCGRTYRRAEVQELAEDRRRARIRALFTEELEADPIPA